MPLHKVEPAVPVHAAPDEVAFAEVVPGHDVDDVLPFVAGLGHPVVAYGARVADLAPAAGIERGGVQDDLVALNGHDLRLEVEKVAVASEDLVSHGIADALARGRGSHAGTGI